MVVFDEPKQFVEFLSRHRLTSDQFLFMFLIYREDYESLYMYTEQVKGLLPQEIQDLVRRGYLKNENKDSNQYFADSFIVTEKFTSEIFEIAKDAATEFWDAYPPLLFIEGKRFSAKSADKELFLDKYTKQIGYSLRLHKKVMSALKYGIGINAINMGIDKWFRSEQWKQLEEEMNVNANVGERYGDKEF